MKNITKHREIQHQLKGCTDGKFYKVSIDWYMAKLGDFTCELRVCSNFTYEYVIQGTDRAIVDSVLVSRSGYLDYLSAIASAEAQLHICVKNVPPSADIPDDLPLPDDYPIVVCEDDT